MRIIISAIICTIISLTAGSKPRCQSFSNTGGKVTVVFVDDKAGDRYVVTDAVFVTYGRQYEATSVNTKIENGVATVTLTFPHITSFSNPKMILRVNGKKKKIKVCG